VIKLPAIHPHRILECLTNRRFGVEYQPLVCTKTGETQCHEALARFIDSAGRPLPPDLVFEALHENPLLLLHAELEMKRLQMAEAPQHGLLFVNLDPDSYAVGIAENGKNVFLPVLLPQRSRLVVEVIENLHLQDILRAESMMQALGEEKVRMAIDDLSSSRGLVSYSALAQASFLKFDRSWLSGNLTAKQRTILTWAIAQAIDLGLTTVLEGIETQQQLDMAKDMGFDLVQGFLFRERFIQRGCAIKQKTHSKNANSLVTC
jgi:EAL domain-containing protein (putative c-di-GMP-specific phosphodiesterase class I)